MKKGLVEIDKHSGFCFGVTRAVEKAEQVLEESGRLNCLGSIVHNEQEVLRLEGKGLKVVGNDNYETIKDDVVLFRAHGEPPVRYEKAMEQGLTIIDATCPVVLKLQQRIKKAYEKVTEGNGQVLIFGKKGHAEVVGLEGQTEFNAVVIQSEEDLEKVDYAKTLYLYSQTTQSIEKFKQIAELIKANAEREVFVYDTICRQVADRAPKLIEFVKKYDTVVFVGGKQSSNGKYLYGVCKQHNQKSYFVSCVDELEELWFTDSKNVGVCGATSTPRWQMEEVAAKIEELLEG